MGIQVSQIEKIVFPLVHSFTKSPINIHVNEWCAFQLWGWKSPSFLYIEVKQIHENLQIVSI